MNKLNAYEPNAFLYMYTKKTLHSPDLSNDDGQAETSAHRDKIEQENG